MERIRAIDPTLPVLVMTAWSSVAGAVEAMRRGARDYIEKPWDDDAPARDRADAGRAAARAADAAAAAGSERAAAAAATTPAVHRASRRRCAPSAQTIERVAPSDANVLITGEHGTGKEVVAPGCTRLSRAAARPLVTMNAGGLAEGVAESELFGHVKGAFTDARTDRIGCFELADGGTLFLDEIANMPMRLQAKLLRVLQTGEMQRVGSSRVRYVNVRVLSATNADLAAEVRAGPVPRRSALPPQHRRDPLPPLRDRREDIAAARRALSSRTTRARYGKPLAGFDADALRRSRRTAGRATSASWRTASSARC